LAQEYRRLDDLELWVPIAREPHQVCRLERACWTATLDADGLRNTPGVAGAGSPRIVVVGDSFVLGAGVDDDQTLPRQLQARLQAAGSPGARVVNAGLAGTSLVTFPALLRYGSRGDPPDLAVVLVNSGDHVTFDSNTRLERVHRDLLWRLLAALNLEAAVDWWIFHARPYPLSPSDLVRLRACLDQLLEACNGRPLLLVTEVVGAFLQPLQEWLSMHPEVGWFDAAASEAWHHAEDLGDDPHWSPRGNETIAGLLEGPVVQMLAGRIHRDPPRVNAPSSGRGPQLAGLASDTLSIEPDPDSNTSRLKLRLPDGAEVLLKAYWCAGGEFFLRVGRVCFSIEQGPVQGREDEVRQALESLRLKIEAAGPPSSD
jgi:hypothetical protein